MESAARCEGADRSCRSSITRSIRPDCHPGRLAPIWQAAEHFLRANGNRTIPVAEIYDLWRKPPFGVKDGLMPVLAVGLATPLAGHDVHALQLKVLRGETRGSRAMLRGCGLAPDKTFNQGVPGSNPGGLTISRHSPARFFRAPCLSSSRTILRRGGSTNRSCWRRPRAAIGGQLFLVVKVLKPWIKASGLGIEGG